MSDEQLDQRLRDVSMPVGLDERLRAIPLDLETEVLLRDFHPPVGFLSRVRTAVMETAIEEQLGEAPGVREVVARLHNEPYRQRQRARRAWGWATGIAAAFTAVLVQAASWIGVMQLTQRPHPAPEMRMVLDVGPLQLTSEPPAPPIVELDSFGEPETPEPVDWVVSVESPQLPDDLGRASDVFELVRSDVDLDMDTVLAKWSVFGARNDPEAITPVMDRVATPVRRGWEPPLSRRGYDRGMLLRQRETPPIQPINRQLATIRPPLTTNTTSVDVLNARSREGRLAGAEDIRVEDIVAGQRYGYIGSPTRGLGLDIYGGPSPFTRQSWRMLQLGLVANRPGVPEPTHWSLAIDVSSSMAWRDRLASIRRAVERLMVAMRPEDRLSLVVFREDAFAAAELVTRDQVDEVLGLLGSVEARGRGDILAGVRAGVASAEAGGFDGRRRLVVLSAGRESWPQELVEQVMRARESARRRNVEWQWIELADADRSSAMIESLRVAGDDARQIENRDEAAWAMLASWRGHSLKAASDVELTVRFEHRSVAFYRLVGHRPSAWAGLETASPDVDLRLGEEATTLFEVLLTPDGPSRVAVATVRWTDPATGKRRTLNREISRTDFASNFADSAPALQFATLAAEAGEVLSRSVFATNQNRTLRSVIAQAGRVDGQLAERIEFQRFAAWLRSLEGVRQRGGD